MKELKMSESPSFSRNLNIDPEKMFCRLCEYESGSFYDLDCPCFSCKMIITNFEVKD